MILFYTTAVDQNFAYLNDEEAHHCTKVLRKKIGDQIICIDGRGGWYEGELSEIQKNKCLVAITKKSDRPKTWNSDIHIAIAPTKNMSRFEWFLEKSVEIGIDQITPIITTNSERKKIRVDRLEKVILAATKQSLKAVLPILNPIQSYQSFLEDSHINKGFIAHCHSATLPPLSEEKVGDSFTILIGPEGDFTQKEVGMALDLDWQAISLGRSRLRTETAGLVACHTIHVAESLQDGTVVE